MVVFITSKGWMNAVVFGFTPDVRSRLAEIVCPCAGNSELHHDLLVDSQAQASLDGEQKEIESL
jgi:hypothetical protein